MSKAGKLIVFEGPDGTGKTTLSRSMVDSLQAAGIKTIWLSFPGRESGTLGKLVYEIHHHPQTFSVGEIHSASNQLLHIAAHIDAIERVIRPALRDGTSVVLDRYWWSTWVYGIAAGANPDSLQQMIKVEQVHWAPVVPDAVFLLERDMPKDESLGSNWGGLVKEYAHLAAKESLTCRVERLTNNATADAALAAALKILGPIIGLGTRRLASKGKNAAISRPAVVATAAASVWVKLGAMKPTPVYDTYWRFAVERQAVFFRRLTDRQPPWTDDAILREYKFTNAFRASDRVSQYLIRNVIYDGDQSPDELFFRTLLFKVFNRIATWELLRSQLGEITYANFDFDRYDRVLTKAIDRGDRIYSAAYIMPSGGSRSAAEGGRKHRMHLRLIETMLREEVPGHLVEAKSMGRAFYVLRSYPTIGDFLAYQFVTDLNYSTLTDFSEMQFVVPGPGARDGLRKCFSDLGGLNESEAIRVVTERQDMEFEHLGLKFQNLWGRKLQLIDCQNLFCEVDKYARVKHPDVTGLSGRTRIKQRYRPSSNDRVAYWYPPKWGINDAVDKDTHHVSQLLWSNRG